MLDPRYLHMSRLIAINSGLPMGRLRFVTLVVTILAVDAWDYESGCQNW